MPRILFGLVIHSRLDVRRTRSTTSLEKPLSQNGYGVHRSFLAFVILTYACSKLDDKCESVIRYFVKIGRKFNASPHTALMTVLELLDTVSTPRLTLFRYLKQRHRSIEYGQHCMMKAMFGVSLLFPSVFETRGTRMSRSRSAQEFWKDAA